MKRTLPVFLILSLLSCAKQTQPTGGPKDEKPPELISSNPANKSTNFKGSQIELDFSEMVQLNNPKEQIIISPSVKGFESIAKKNRVILKFNSKLKDSTTYTINLRESIQDVTERNPAKNTKLAFSTGKFLDSLSISGTVIDALSNKPVTDITVAAYAENDTINIFKHKAEIITKADSKGTFILENLKVGSYKLYAFLDKNKNLIVESKVEKYAFLSQPIPLTEALTNVKLPLVSLDARPLKIISSRPIQNYFNIKLNKSVADYKITYTDTTKAIYTTTENNSTVKLYNTRNSTDSITIRLQLRDSVDHIIDTMIYAKFNKYNPQLRLDKFSVKVDNTQLLDKSNLLTSTIQFNKPITTIYYDSILFQQDSANYIRFKPEDIKMDTQKLTLYLSKIIPLEKGTTSDSEKNITAKTSKKRKVYNELILGKGAFMSIDNDSSKRSTFKLNPIKSEDLSIVLVETNTKAKNYIIELLDSQGKTILSYSNKAKDTLNDIPPGTYSLRLFIDENNNAKWDAGNPLKNIEPEPIYYYISEEGLQTFIIRTNWEYGPLLISTENNVNKLGTSKSKK